MAVVSDPMLTPGPSAGGILGLPTLDAALVREAFAVPGVEAIQMPRPALTDTGYAGLVHRLLAAPRFMSDFSQAPVATAFEHLCSRMLGRVAADDAYQQFLDGLLEVERFARSLCGPRVLVSVRNWFAPGDLVWHVDRSARDAAYRILWPLGRSEGMRVTPADNLDLAVYGAFMRREHPILCRLDREIAGTGHPLEVLWRHRPRQVHAMVNDDFAFIHDRARIDAVHPTAISVHRIETPRMKGTYHRSAWGNRHSPGLQVIVTATSN